VPSGRCRVGQKDEPRCDVGEVKRLSGIRLKVKNLHKSFGSVKALAGVDLTVEPGEVTAVVGDNGAGKSTFVKIISGILVPDEGRIIIDDRVYTHLTPALAIQEGIATVYQDLALVNCGDVATNVFLGRELTRGIFLDRKRMYSRARKVLEEMGINLPAVDMLVGLLSGGQRQAVAMARAVNMGGRLFVLDEPTAALGYKETCLVLDLIRRLRDQGYSVIIISHNLHQVFSIADSICVFRHGRVVSCTSVKHTDPETVVKLITGTETA